MIQKLIRAEELIGHLVEVLEPGIFDKFGIVHEITWDSNDQFYLWGGWYCTPTLAELLEDPSEDVPMPSKYKIRIVK